jgi:hypothetical protein
MFHTFMDGDTQQRNLSPILCPRSADSLFWRVSTEFYSFALEINLIYKTDGPLVATIDFFTGYIIEIFYILNDAEDNKKIVGDKEQPPKGLWHITFQDKVSQNRSTEFLIMKGF